MDDFLKISKPRLRCMVMSFWAMPDIKSQITIMFYRSQRTMKVPWLTNIDQRF